MAESLRGTYISSGVVAPEWIDINNHMNVAWYVLAFDLAIDSLWEKFGIDAEYISRGKQSTFAVETHVTYQQELVEGDAYNVHAEIIAFDEKRIHHFQRLYHASENYLAATAEWMNLHMNMQSRRVSPWPPDVLQRIADFAAAQSDSTYPTEAGRTMQIAKPLYNLVPEQDQE